MTLGAYAYIDEATYWEVPQANGYGGISFSSPRLLMTKWEESIQQFTNNDGEMVISRAVVYLLEEVPEGGYLILGDYTAYDDPTLVNRAYHIKRVDTVRDLRGLNKEIVCYLA